MKLKDLIESVAEATKTKRKTKIRSKSIRRRHKHPFTRLVIMIFELNVKYDVNEAIAYMPKSFKGKSGNHFDYKVEIIMEYLNKAIVKLDYYIEKMPNLMDLDKIHFRSNLKDLVNELNSVIEQVIENHERTVNYLNYDIKKEILTQRKLNHYKILNEEIKTFNEMISFLHKFFNTKVKGKDTNTILYNPDELKYKKLINKTLSLKLKPIEVPKEPIQKKRDINEGLSIRPEDREEA